MALDVSKLVLSAKTWLHTRSGTRQNRGRFHAKRSVELAVPSASGCGHPLDRPCTVLDVSKGRSGAGSRGQGILDSMTSSLLLRSLARYLSPYPTSWLLSSSPRRFATVAALVCLPCSL